jgi:FixJ family two-component response regulator
MSVEQMKKEAIDRISRLSGENALKEILDQLDRLEPIDRSDNKKKIEEIYQKAVEKYGDVLKKLAE